MGKPLLLCANHESRITHSVAHFSMGPSGTDRAYRHGRGNRFTEIPGSLLRHHRVDVESGPPLKACDLGQARHNLDVPVVGMFRFAPVRKSVDNEVVWRIVQTDVQAMEHYAQCLGEETLLIWRQGAKIGLMAFGKDQGLE